MKNIEIEFTNNLVEKQKVELVERKGTGHPDSICDGIAEAVSRALSKEYLKRFDAVLHHNTDQVELVGGEAKPEFGGGEIIKPMYILLSGRATTYTEESSIPVHRVAINAAKNYIRENFPNIDVETDFIIDSRIGQGSADLQDVFKRKGEVPRSNDTSFGCGFAPFSLTEKLVLEIERYINKPGKKLMNEIGEDVKVMGLRRGDNITLTIAAPTISKYINDLDANKSAVEELQSKLEDFIAKLTDNENVELCINTADNYETGVVYLTVTGTSAEQGDDGSVGRGNRCNGLITPYRPKSIEATAGKNPVNHVGKLYNLLANEIARDIAGAGAEQAYVRIMSQIGKPINDPLIASIELVGDGGMKNEVRDIVDKRLDNITEITKWCVEGKVTVF